MTVNEWLWSFLLQVVNMLVEKGTLNQDEAGEFLQTNFDDLQKHFEHFDLNFALTLPRDKYFIMFIRRLKLGSYCFNGIHYLVFLAGKYFIYSCLMNAGKVKEESVKRFYNTDLLGLENELAVLEEQYNSFVSAPINYN